MYSHVDHRRNKAVLRQLFSIFLIFTLYFNSISQAHASGLNGWTLQNPIVKGASVAYEGVKNVIINGKNVAKTSTALITPTATQVAKVLVRGAGGYALSVAVAQLIGEGIDWVLDPANNQIKYHTKPDDPSTSSPELFYLPYYPDKKFNTLDAAIAFAIEDWNKKPNGWGVITGIRSTTKPYPTQYVVDVIYKNYPDWVSPLYINTTANPNYDPNEQGEEKTIPLPTVADKIISNAESGDTDAQVVTTAAAADIVNDAQNDDAKARPIVNQLESNAKTEADNTATGETKPNTSTGGTDLALEFPAFCGWAPQVCEAAQTVISFPQTLTDWWNTTNEKADSWAKSISEAYTSAKEWFQEDKENNEDNDVPEIKDIEIGQLDTSTFKASAGCPQPIQVPVKMGSGGNVEISYEPICQFARSWSFVAPLIGFLSGAMIIVGVGRKGEDGEI